MPQAEEIAKNVTYRLGASCWIVLFVLLAQFTASALAEPATSPAKAAAPDAAAQSKAEKVIRDIFKKEYAARSPEERGSFANTLRKQAAETTNDPAARFVLLRESRDIGASAGDFTAAFDAIDELDRSFVVDPNEMKWTVLKSASRNLSSPAVQKEFISACLSLGKSGASNQNFDLAIRALSLAEPIARNAREFGLLTTVQSRNVEYARLKTEQVRVKAAEDRLASNHANAEDFLTVGQYLCFTKSEWERGLPLLAKSADPTLKPLAARENANPNTPLAQRELADAWWAFAEKMKGSSATHIRSHAATWYLKGMSGLSGLEKTLAEKRIATAAAEEKQGTAEANQPQWISKTAKYTVGSTDANSGNHVPLQKLLDGTGGGYQNNEFAFHTAFEDNPFIIIDLGMLDRIQRIEIINRRDHEIERAKTLAVWVSAKPDGPWIAVWQAEKAEKEWTVDLPGPVTARYVKIGLREHTALHLFSVKVFGWEGP